jgi:hypothetical protein
MELVGTGEDPESRIEREIWRLGEEGVVEEKRGVSHGLCATRGGGKE